MKRRKILQLALPSALAACQLDPIDTASHNNQDIFRWKMATTWPPNFPGLGSGARQLVDYIERCSNGRIQIDLYSAGELVPAFEVFDAVSQGAVEMGHSGAYYWRGKSEAVQFFSSVPFGMNAHGVNSWIYYGGGLDLWREVYAPFGVIPFPAGNSGVQMGGWYNKKIERMEDFQGLKMRLPGIAGEALRLAGGIPVTLPGAELFTALSTGTLDAVEWVGPYNDLAFGLHQAAQYYYYPGWHEPGPIMECIVNENAFNSLPDDLRAIVRVTCQAANLDMISEYNARNARALSQIRQMEGIEIVKFPKEVLTGLKERTNQVIAEMTARDPLSAKIWSSYNVFMSKSQPWFEVSELAYLNL